MELIVTMAQKQNSKRGESKNVLDAEEPRVINNSREELLLSG